MEIQGFKERILELASEFGKGKIRKFSQKVGISEKLGRAIIELGQIPKADTLLKIARSYGKTVDWLLTGEAIMSDEKDHKILHRKAAESHETYSTNIIKEDSALVRGLLVKAQEVLHADHHAAGALDSNIRSFHASLKDHEQAKLEKKECQDLKKRIEYLEKEIRKTGSDPPLSRTGGMGGEESGGDVE